MKLKFQENELELVPIWYNYLYSYLIRFSSKNHVEIDWNNEEIVIPNDMKPIFANCIRMALSELLTDCYEEPNHKQRSKYTSHYQKIEFEGQKYVLNYRTDTVGIIAYGLFYILSVIDSG